MLEDPGKEGGEGDEAVGNEAGRSDQWGGKGVPRGQEERNKRAYGQSPGGTPPARRGGRFGVRE